MSHKQRIFKQRILVVENEDDLRTQYATGLDLADFEVDSAENLQAALDLIEAKTFHVALVDLMLTDSDTTMDGLEVLKNLQTLGEGTKAIVLSGQDNPGTAADTITEYQAVKYIPKSKIIAKGMKYLIEEISQLATSADLKKYGDAGSSIFSVLARGVENELVWTDSLLRILEPTKRYTGLKKFLTKFCEPMVPLMPKKGSSPPLTFYKEQRFANGKFWSKGLGRPLELVVCRADEAAEILKEENRPEWQNAPLEDYENYGLKGYAFGLPDDVARSEFVENL